MTIKPTSNVKRLSRVLRQQQTEPEAILWRYLRNRSFEGYKFRRQQPIGPFIVDFYCNAAKLAIEIDGSGHLEPDTIDYDQARTASLSELGVRIIRFWNSDVTNNTNLVLEQIKTALEESS